MKSTITLDGNKMTHVQVEENGRISKHVREFFHDKLLVVRIFNPRQKKRSVIGIFIINSYLLSIFDEGKELSAYKIIEIFWKTLLDIINIDLDNAFCHNHEITTPPDVFH